jgi:transposase
MAHLLRDVRYLTTLPDKVTRSYGERVLDALKRLFQVLHRRARMAPENFTRALMKARDLVLAKALAAPPRREAKSIADRFRSHEESYFRFVTTPGIEPTNNLAEQSIRHVVIDRRITQGTRGATGRRWSERIWTTMATCAQQGRSVFEFLHDAMHARVTHKPAPSLLPMTSGP